MTDPPSTKVRPGSSAVFLRKAREFARGMDGALAQGDVNRAALDASHCVISACDAVLARTKGVRSAARDHLSVVDLVARLDIEGASDRAAQAEAVLSLKHLAAYDDREVTAKDAERAVKQARRVLEWAEAALGG